MTKMLKKYKTNHHCGNQKLIPKNFRVVDFSVVQSLVKREVVVVDAVPQVVGLIEFIGVLGAG